jgi:hypothetical protein
MAVVLPQESMTEKTIILTRPIAFLVEAIPFNIKMVSEIQGHPETITGHETDCSQGPFELFP